MRLHLVILPSPEARSEMVYIYNISIVQLFEKKVNNFN